MRDSKSRATPEEYTPVETLASAVARNVLPELCSQYREYSEAIKALDADRKEVMAQIREAADNVPDDRVQGTDWVMTRVTPKPRRRLSETKLVANGVDLDVLEASYDVTPSKPYYRIGAPPASAEDMEI